LVRSILIRLFVLIDWVCLYSLVDLVSLLGFMAFIHLV
jgi:hypothetical protein